MLFSWKLENKTCKGLGLQMELIISFTANVFYLSKIVTFSKFIYLITS